MKEPGRLGGAVAGGFVIVTFSLFMCEVLGMERSIISHTNREKVTITQPPATAPPRRPGSFGFSNLVGARLDHWLSYNNDSMVESGDF